MKARPVVARALAATACGLEAAIAVYAITRVMQALLVPDPNPATLIRSLHAGYFWRAWTAAFAGGFVALTAGFLARRAETLARLALAALPWSALLALLQAIVCP